MVKYIVVTGGVISGIGKGITISSIGRILKSSGLRVTSIKIDPYLNVDAGTMSPFEHGETFVLDDGGETDLDLGNYERFLDIKLSGRHNITTGKVYKEVINAERRGDYLGKTVQIVPHVTDMIQSWIKEVSKRTVDGTGIEPDVCLIEVGGTVGDIESAVFLEALRQFQFVVGRQNILFIHVSHVVVMGGEQKTKPTQHSVKELRGLGLAPDVIVCRCECKLEASVKGKIGTFCHVDPANVLSVHNVSNIYHVPLILVEQGLHSIIKKQLNLETMAPEPSLAEWTSMAHIYDSASRRVEVAIVGKYTNLQDAYLSVTKALIHSGIHLCIKIIVHWIEAADLEDATAAKTPEKHAEAWRILRSAAGVVVPGGFGVRGVEGKIACAKYCRENKKPYLGVCLGMQVMVIEYARSVLGLAEAQSAEFDERTPHPVVVFMPEVDKSAMGGTMRLGARPTSIVGEYPHTASTAAAVAAGDEASVPAKAGVGAKGGSKAASSSKSASASASTSSSSSLSTTATLAAEVYGLAPSSCASTAQLESTSSAFFESVHKSNAGSAFSVPNDDWWHVLERHRHRYEVNPARVEELEAAGLYFTGRDDTGERMEIAEVSRAVHPFYFGVQFHPEFKSKPNRPSPPFFAFACAAAGLGGEMSRAGLLFQAHEAAIRDNINKSPTKKRARSGSFSITSGGNSQHSPAKTGSV
jgi:CTP synthase